MQLPRSCIAKFLRRLSSIHVTKEWLNLTRIVHYLRNIYLDCVQGMAGHYTTYSTKSSSKEVLDSRGTSSLFLWGFHHCELLFCHVRAPAVSCTKDLLQVIFRCAPSWSGNAGTGLYSRTQILLTHMWFCFGWFVCCCFFPPIQGEQRSPLINSIK